MARLSGVVYLSRKHLRHRFLESLLILLGIAVGVGVLTGMESFLRYLDAVERETLRAETRLRSITVAPRTFDTSQFYGEGALPAVRIAGGVAEPATLTVEDLLEARRNVPGIAYAMGTVGRVTWHPVVAADGGPLERRAGEGEPPRFSLQLTRVTPDQLLFEGRALVAGRLMTWDEYLDKSPVLVLEEQSVAALFPGRTAHDAVGRTLTVRAPVESESPQGMEWRVIGVVADRPWSPFAVRSVGGETLIPAYASHTAGVPEPVVLQELAFAPADESHIERLVNDLEVYFAQKLGAGRVTVANPLLALRQLSQERKSITLTLMGLAGLALLVASVNILNLMTAQVFRRRRLLATSIALGAERRLLFGRMAAEALLLGVGGSAVGLLFASGIVALLRGILEMDAGGMAFPDMTLTIADALFGLAVGALASMLFGLYPAYLSASIDPADGLRAE